MVAILALYLAGPSDLARPFDLYEMTVEEARRLVGQRVEVAASWSSIPRR